MVSEKKLYPYLRLRRKSYHGRMAIPQELRHKFLTADGKPMSEFRQPFKTRDEREAIEQLWPWVAEKKNELKRATLQLEAEKRTGLRDLTEEDINRLNLQEVNKRHKELLDDLSQLDDSSEFVSWDKMADGTFDDDTTVELKDSGFKVTQESIDARRMPRFHANEKAHRLVELGQPAPDVPVNKRAGVPIELHLDAYLEDALGNAKTRVTYKSKIKKFADWLERKHQTGSIDYVNHDIAADYLIKELDNKLARKTTISHKSALSSYWTWLQESRIVPQLDKKIWLDHRFPKRASKKTKGKGENKRRFTDDEVVRLFEKIKEQSMLDFMQVAALSGMRQTEIANLRIKDCKNGFFKIDESKTKAGEREVPIHSDLELLLQRRRRTEKGIEKKAGDFLFDEFPTPENAAISRGDAPGKKFGRLRKKYDVHDQPEGFKKSKVDFHSFRRWFVFKASDARQNGALGFNEWTIAEVVGHDTENNALAMTMNTYAGSSGPEARKACVESVKLPDNDKEREIG